MIKAAVLIADGFEESEAIVPYDIMKRGGVDAELISVSGRESAQGAQGIVITNLTNIKDYDFGKARVLVLPGGGGRYEILRQDETVLRLVKEFARDKIIAAICASGAILGELGLLKGKNYTCYPTMNGDFGGNYKNMPTVIDGNIVTGIGPGGAFPFGYALVEKLVGKDAAEKLKNETCWSSNSPCAQ